MRMAGSRFVTEDEKRFQLNNELDSSLNSVATLATDADKELDAPNLDNGALSASEVLSEIGSTDPTVKLERLRALRDSHAN